jgi:DNA-binding response OmpR family regulator
MIRIIVVEDKEDLRRGLLTHLVAHGFDATGVAGSARLYLELLQQPADIVILNVDLRDEDGFAIARQLRSIQCMRMLGIIILTPHTELSQRIESLESGADVFLTKPVDPDELRAYINSLYRRLHFDHRTNKPVVWCFRPNEWKLISPSGAGIELSHLEAAFLEIIARNAGKPVKRRDIISVAFGQDPLSYDNRRLEAIVSRLLKKVHRTYPLSQPIKVVHSIGYVFTDAIQCQ